jgi:hypothetical protein
MLGHFPIDYLQARSDALSARVARAEQLGGTEELLFHFRPQELGQYPVFAHLGLLSGDGVEWLRVETAVPKDAQIVAVEWVNSATGERKAAVEAQMLPLHLPARGIGSVPRRFDLQLLELNEHDALVSWTLEVSVRLNGRNWIRQFTPARIYPALQESPIPNISVESLAAYEYLRLNHELSRVYLHAGEWNIDETLVIPKGWTLHAGPDTALRFAADASLISHGAVFFKGTAERPVTLGPQPGGSWPGMAVVNAAEKSALHHVYFSSTRGVVTDTWTLLGGVNFYNSDVLFKLCEFRDSRGEDALNIIQSRFELVDTHINETASDAFDADFSSGSVIGGSFRNVGRAGGGDAIDISGSSVQVSGTSFVSISDKALSVGEKSTMNAEALQISDVGTGAASKDGSLLKLRDSVIDGARFAGLTAYVKKPEYGPATIEAEATELRNTETLVLAQTDSAVSVDGELVETRDIDVGALYETIMKPGLR